MFAVGEKVFYKGKAMPKIEYEVEKVIGEFVFVKGKRFKVSSFSKQQQDLLLTELIRKCGNRIGTCSYAIRFADGRDRFQVADVCHARLRWGGYEEPEEFRHKANTPPPIAVALNVKGHLEQVKADSEEYKNMKQMYEYILLRSPWRDAFVQKPLQDVFTSGVYLDINKPYSFVVAAAIALRTVSEFPKKTQMFCRCVNVGIPEHIAFVMSVMYDGKYFAPFSGGHHVISTNESKLVDVFKFFKQGVRLQNDIPYKEARNQQYSIFESVAPRIREAEDGWMPSLTRAAKHLFIEHKTAWGMKYKAFPTDTNKQLVEFAFVMKGHFDA